MKKPFLALPLLMAVQVLSAQHVTESPLTMKRKFSPLFGSTSSVMMMSLCKDYDIGGRDTVYSFQLVVSETEREVSGMSIGFSSFSIGSILGGGSSVGASVDVNKQDGAVVLGPEKFQHFYKCINEVYRAAGGMAARKEKNNALCTCGLDGVTFGGEYLPGGINGNDTKFYFKLDEAAFSMSKEEFEDIVKFVKECREGMER